MDTPAPPLVICLMGPTASGKTDLAIALCEHLPCDIISVDSALIYRGMDIGTAKPDAATLARAPHRLIDIRWPEEIYSAADFRADALREIEIIVARGRIPLLVGGTMMYFKALLQGMGDLPLANPELRRLIEADAEQRGWAALHAELAVVDPAAAALIHPHNRQRMLRALEVYRSSGRPLSSFWYRDGVAGVNDANLTDWQQDGPHALPYTVLQFAIAPTDRSELHRRIALRFNQMLAGGLIDEVQRLRERPGLHPELPAMRCVGYRQTWAYLEGFETLQTLSEKGMAATRQLAKRQLTWLRGWSSLHWLASESRDVLPDALKIIGQHTTLS